MGETSPEERETAEKWGVRRGFPEVGIATDPEEGPGVCPVKGRGHSTTTHCGWSVVCVVTRGGEGGAEAEAGREGTELACGSTLLGAKICIKHNSIKSSH